jgi:hypothetical protein
LMSQMPLQGLPHQVIPIVLRHGKAPGDQLLTRKK